MREIKLRVKILRPASGRSPAARVEPCHWWDGYVEVSLHERRATLQVMIGMSLRERWDSTLVNTIMRIEEHMLLIDAIVLQSLFSSLLPRIISWCFFFVASFIDLNRHGLAVIFPDIVLAMTCTVRNTNQFYVDVKLLITVSISLKYEHPQL